jgi:tetratricopeptide (TPR) repeat protein
MTRRIGSALAVLGVVVSLSSPASAQRLEEVFDDANAAVFAGDLDAAIAGYERLVAAGVDDADVAYNLAVAHGRAGHYGQSIRWFERALSLRPGDDEAENGLAEVRAALGRRQAARDGEALVETTPFTEAMVRPFSLSAIAWTVLVLDVLFFAFLLFFRRAASENQRLALGIATPVLGVLLALSAFGLMAKSGVLRDGQPAVVVTEDAAVREGPDRRAERRSDAREGERASILDRDGEWVHVRLTSGREGWMDREDVGAI